MLLYLCGSDLKSPQNLFPIERFLVTMSLIPDFNAGVETIKSVAADAQRFIDIATEVVGKKNSQVAQLAALAHYANETAVLMESAIEDLITPENGEPTDWDDSASTFCAYVQHQARWFQEEFAEKTSDLMAYQMYPITMSELARIAREYDEYREATDKNHS